MTAPSRRKAAALALAVLTALTLLLAECAYRAWVWRTLRRWDSSFNYRLTPSVYVQFDSRHGVRFKPNAECWVSYVDNGRLVWGTVASRSNRDGLGGRTTIAEYGRAAVKILVFGDSFTHWNQDGVTWPDLLEENLRRRLGATAAVLNYGRGTYGVLQMLDLAADEIAEHRPDLVIIAAVGADFKRARWWCKELRRDGIPRWMLSSRPDEFLDYRFAVDEMLVYPPATHQWSLERLAAGGAADAVLAGANTQFRKVRNEVTAVRRDFHALALDRSYLWRRLSRGHPFAAAASLIPEVSFHDFRADARTRANLLRLRQAGASLLFVYLPTAPELAARECLVDRQTRHLMASLEELTGHPFLRIQELYRGKLPARLNLQPFDPHPSRDALQLYADVVTRAALVELAGRRPGTARGGQGEPP